MTAAIKKFVVAKKDTVSPQEILIEKDEVGIVMSEEVDHLTVFFIRIWKQVELSKKDLKFFSVREVGDGFPKKICNICHKLKKTSEFDRNQNGVNNRPVRRPSCKSCRVSMDGKSISSSDRVKWNKVKPVLEPFVCPICKKRTIAGLTSKVVLEHSHLDGKVGGWICDSCNTGLGRFKDDPKLLQSAIQFLKNNY